MTKKKTKRRKRIIPHRQYICENYEVSTLKDESVEAIEKSGRDLSEAIVIHTGTNRKARRKRIKAGRQARKNTYGTKTKVVFSDGIDRGEYE